MSYPYGVWRIFCNGEFQVLGRSVMRLRWPPQASGIGSGGIIMTDFEAFWRGWARSWRILQLLVGVEFNYKHSYSLEVSRRLGWYFRMQEELTGGRDGGARPGDDRASTINSVLPTYLCVLCPWCGYMGTLSGKHHWHAVSHDCRAEEGLV